MSGHPQAAAPGGRAGPSALDADGLRIWSCVTCRRRKVRCDRREPCANCVRNDIDCHYPVTGRIPRRRALPPGHPRSAVSDKHSVLINRLRRLEGIVTELGAQVEEGARANGGKIDFEIPRPAQSTVQSTRTLRDSTEGSVDALMQGMSTGDTYLNLPLAENDMNESFGDLIVARDGSLHVGNDFWTVFCDEVDNIFKAVEDVEFAEEAAEEAESLHKATVPETSSQHNLIFGSGPTGHRDPARLHRLASNCPFLWQKYLENVDPFIKVLDTVNFSSIVRNIANEAGQLPADDEALLFATSLASLVSLEPEEIAANLGQEKNQVMYIYFRDTENSLAHTAFLTQPNLTTMQAFTIYLSTLPYIGRKDLAWPLGGLLLRLATTLGLHRDSAQDAEVDAKTAELRRRLWWQICLLDSGHHALCSAGLSITQGILDTREPMNVENADLDTMAASLNIGETKITTATLSIIRCQVWRLGRRLELQSDTPMEIKLGLVRSRRNCIRGTYFFDIDATKPFDGFLQSMTNLAFAKIESVILSQAIRKAKKEMSERNVNAVGRIQEQLYRIALTIIGEVCALQNKDEWRQWRWQLRGQVPWHAMGVVLSQLERSPWNADSEKTWNTIQAIASAPGAKTTHTNRGIELQALISRVSAHRAASSSSSFTPDALDAGMNSSNTGSSGMGDKEELESPMESQQWDTNNFPSIKDLDLLDTWTMDEATSFWDLTNLWDDE